jgi:hypothetical protein
MRHEAEHVETGRVYSRNRVGRAVSVRLVSDLTIGLAVAEGDQTVPFEPRQSRVVGRVVALAVCDADVDDVLRSIVARKGRVGPLDPDELTVTDEPGRDIAHQHAWQKPRFAQDLEAVADPEHQPAATGVITHRVHDRRASGDRAAAEVVSVREPSRQHDEVRSSRKRRLAMPGRTDLSPAEPQRTSHVAVAIGPRKDDDGGLHGAAPAGAPSSSTR